MGGIILRYFSMSVGTLATVNLRPTTLQMLTQKEVPSVYWRAYSGVSVSPRLQLATLEPIWLGRKCSQGKVTHNESK